MFNFNNSELSPSYKNTRTSRNLYTKSKRKRKKLSQLWGNNNDTAVSLEKDLGLPLKFSISNLKNNKFSQTRLPFIMCSLKNQKGETQL